MKMQHMENRADDKVNQYKLEVQDQIQGKNNHQYF